MAVYKRSDWNNLLDAVNNVLQNPPDGCDPLDPIPHVESPHRWSKADIQEVHDKLMATCSAISFSDIPELWEQSVIDEINEALGEAWCDCEDDGGDDDGDDDGDESGCTDENKYSEHWTTISLMDITYSYCITSGLFGGGTKCRGNGCGAIGGFPNGYTNIGQMINGMQVGAPGIVGRRWLLYRQVGDSVYYLEEWAISCDGRVVCPFDIWVKTEEVFLGACFDCDFSNPACSAAEDVLQERVQTAAPAGYGLRIRASGSAVRCEDCD